jgi:lysozyme family protein
MATFSASYQVVKSNEGGYANNPNDRGGETFKGIARKIFASWKGWQTIDAIKKRVGTNPDAIDREAAKDAGLQTLVHDFYKVNFWDVLKLDLVNDERIATELFDTGVNMGTGVAAIFLQRALNISNRNGKDYADFAIDGSIGPKTLDALNHHHNPTNVLKALNCLQGAKYIAICEANPSQEIFFNSWFSRVAL